MKSAWFTRTNSLFFRGACPLIASLSVALILLRKRRGGGGQKGQPTRFSSVTSTNVKISDQNIMTLSFNLFATLV